MSIDLEQYRYNSILCRFADAGEQIIRGDDPHEGVCVYCNESKSDIANRRLNTQYADDDSNWMESCGECFNDRIEYYRERWAEYYGNIL